MDLEERIGKRWSTWAGAVALLFAAGFYLQLASGSGGWLGPIGKMAIAIVAGAIAIFLGDRALRRDARVLGQGLIGAGLGVVFGALYAGHALYGLYDPELAALALVGVTTAGMVLAVRHDAAPIAVLAVLGGFMTPALASSGGDAGDKRDILFAYLTVLDLGVLGVALARRWRGLEWLAFAGTWVMFAGWYHRTEDPSPALTLVWCAGFFAIFLAVPLVYHLRRGLALSRDRLALVLLDGAVGFGFACEILDGVAVHLAWVALAMAGAYLVLAAVVRQRLAGDQLAYAAFAVVSAGFATLAAPLALRAEGIMLAWALEGPVLVWLGTRHRLSIVRHAGAAVVLLATARLLGVHWPSPGEGVVPFLHAGFASAFAVAAAAGLYAWGAASAARRFHDRVGRGLAIGAVILAGVLVLALVHTELWLGLVLRGHGDGAYVAVLAWWLIAAGGALAVAWRGYTVVWVVTLALAIGTSVIALAVATLPPWPGLLFGNPRFVLVAATAALWLGVWRCQPRLRGAGDLAELHAVITAVTPIAVFATLWTLVTLEAWQGARLGIEDPEMARWHGQAALSCAWSVFAGATLALGLRLGVAPLRFAGLALLGLTVAKVMVVDLSQVQQIYRVSSFLVLGLLLFTVSWLYHRVR